MKKIFLILIILLFSCSRKEHSNSVTQKVNIESKDLDSNFRKLILEYQKTYPVKNPRKGNIYIYSAAFYRDNNDTIIYLTRGGAGISEFTAKDNFAFGVYSDSELKNLIIFDSLKLSSKLVLNYKRNFSDSLIWKDKSFPESISPLSTFKLKNGIVKLVKTDTIWNHWD